MRWLLATGMILSIGLMANPAQAQGQFGAQLSFADDTDFGIGVRAQNSFASFVEPESRLSVLTGVLSLDFFFPDCDPVDCSYFEINGNALYPLDVGEGFAPYMGGGLNIARISVDAGDLGGGDSSDTDVGLNLLGGTTFELGGFNTFGELKVEIGGVGKQVVSAFGVLFFRVLPDGVSTSRRDQVVLTFGVLF